MTTSNEISLILDTNEEIIKSYKPNKKRFIYLNIIGSIFPLLIGLVLIVLAILMSTGVIIFTDSDGDSPALFLYIFGGVWSGLILISVLSRFISYYKTVYCVTNKRIIIKHGVIGTDFKSVELKSVTSIDVNVGFLDKLVKPNTGTLTFGTASSPISNNNGTSRGYFAFNSIENPYDAYREIKESVSGNK